MLIDATTAGEGIRYFGVSGEFDPDSPNPFTQDGAYSPAWTSLIIADRWDASDFMGCNTPRTLFLFRLGRRLRSLEWRLADFLRHENRQGRNVILAAPRDMDIDALVERCLAKTPPPHVVRESDPRYVVHSTSMAAGERILADGELKCLSFLMANGTITEPRLGHHGLCEPAEHADYVNLGPWESPWPEAVTSSNQKGRFVALDEPYDPGYRFYFDGHAIIRRGLDVRTGGTYFCVEQRLPLDGFLRAAVRFDDVDPDRTGTWTPATYVLEANRVFRQSVPEA